MSSTPQVDHVEAAAYRASQVCLRLKDHLRASEAETSTRERYNRRATKDPSSCAAVVESVLRYELLDEASAGFLIRDLARPGSAELALATAQYLLTKQPRLGATASVVDAALTVAATACFRPDAAKQWYGRRAGLQLPPSLCACNMAITAASHSGDVDWALQVLEDIRRQGLQPNDYTLIMVLQAANYKRRGRHKEAVRALAYLPPHLPLSSEVMDLLLAVFEAAIFHAASLEQAEQVFAEVQGLGLADSTRVYNALLRWCARRGHWRRAQQHFQAMAAQDIPADTATFHALINACVEGGALEAALDIYECLVAGREVAEPIAADISTYNALIKACHQAGLLEKALEIASWVMSSGVQFDGTTYDELIATLEIAQLWDVKAAKGISSGSFLASKVERKDHCFAAPGRAPGAGQLTRLEASRNPVATVRSGMEFTLFPDQLRPAPFDGLRFMYLDHLEDLQEEAALAALKLRTSSWAASTLMRGGRGQTGKHTPPACTSAPEAAASSGIFTNSFGAAPKRPALPPHLPRILAPFTPVALSRAPSFK
ncbi:hypothetical protein V8C86DRAFT_2901986 [Haematococcus lacustris]